MSLKSDISASKLPKFPAPPPPPTPELLPPPLLLIGSGDSRGSGDDAHEVHLFCQAHSFWRVSQFLLAELLTGADDHSFYFTSVLLDAGAAVVFYAHGLLDLLPVYDGTGAVHFHQDPPEAAVVYAFPFQVATFPFDVDGAPPALGAAALAFGAGTSASSSVSSSSSNILL